MAKILLIEKDDLSCRILRQQLKQKGYDIITATEGGDQGIVLAVTTSPDLILVDTALPTINGWQTTKILKTSTVTQKIPVVILTTPITPTDWTKLSESNCDDYSLKPLNVKSLSDKIEILLKGLPAVSDVDKGIHNRATNQQSRTKEGLKTVGAPWHFPTDISNASIVVPKTRLPKMSSRPMIIHIENNPANSQAMAKISWDAGYTYVSFADSFQALPLLLKFKPQLILLNSAMPIVNGYELCARIRRIPDIGNTPIVIMAKNDRIVERMRAKAVGASDLLEKTIQKEYVLKVLKRYLRPA